MCNNVWSGFRVWCQKVLPLVYDDSLSYYEVLCKTLNYLNEFAEKNEILENEFNELKNFVDNYFNNLDVQNEVNNKINEMVENGYFNQLINKDILNNSTFVQLTETKQRAIFFGDSITWGDLGNGKQANEPYPTVYGKISGLNITNMAFGGSTAGNNQNVVNNEHYLQKQIDLIDFSNFQQMFIAHGANDWAYSTPLGDIFSENEATFYGAYNKAIKTALSENKDIEIILITSFYAQSSQHKETNNKMMPETNSIGLSIYDYNDCIKNIAGKYNLRVVEMLDALGINDYNYNSYIVDDVHMNQKGYTLVGEYLAKQLSFNKPYNIFNKTEYDKQKSSINIVNPLDFIITGIGTSEPNIYRKSGVVINLDLKGTQALLSRQKYKLFEGIVYSFHTYLYIANGTSLVCQLKDSSGNLKRIYNIGNGKNNKILNVHTIFIPDKTDNYILDFSIANNGNENGNAILSDITINEGYSSIVNNQGQGFYTLTKWKVNEMLSDAQDSPTNQLFYYMTEDGIVHLGGQCTISMPNVEKQCFRIPKYFLPQYDSIITVPSTTGEYVSAKFNIADGVITILPNSEIKKNITIDFSGVTYVATKQNPMLVCDIVENL